MDIEHLQAENKKLRHLLERADFLLCKFAVLGMTDEEKSEWEPVPGSIIAAVHEEVHKE